MNNRFLSALVMFSSCVLVSGKAVAAVEYVKVCSAYGVGFLYIPGTDTCFNVSTGETRQATEGGVWYSSAPTAPIQWVSNEEAGCLGGTVFDLGTIGRTDFVLNDYAKFETTGVPLALGEGDFISNIMMHGDLTRVTAAVGAIRFTGVDTAEIPEGTELVRADNVRYVTTSTGIIGETTPGEVEVSARASLGGMEV